VKGATKDLIAPFAQAKISAKRSLTMHLQNEDNGDDAAAMAQMLGFSSFGAQDATHPSKKRRYNPHSDHAVIAPTAAPVGGNVTTQAQHAGTATSAAAAITSPSHIYTNIPPRPPSQRNIASRDLVSPHPVRTGSVAELHNDHEIDLDDEDNNNDNDKSHHAGTDGTDGTDLLNANSGQYQSDISTMLATKDVREGGLLTQSVSHSLPYKPPPGINASPRVAGHGMDNSAMATFLIESGDQEETHRGRGGRKPWWEGYYDPTSNENPWEKLEQAMGLEPKGTWCPRTARSR
jgi:hypothetical protein